MTPVIVHAPLKMGLHSSFAMKHFVFSAFFFLMHLQADVFSPRQKITNITKLWLVFFSSLIGIDDVDDISSKRINR